MRRLSPPGRAELDEATRQATAFASFDELVYAQIRHGYIPTLCTYGNPSPGCEELFEAHRVVAYGLRIRRRHCIDRPAP